MKCFSGKFPELQTQLEAHFARVRACGEQLRAHGAEAVILGGGYGRGEGGVRLNPRTGQYQLFNDLDYFLFCKSPSDAGLQGWIHTFSRQESEALGIDVEFKALRKTDASAPNSTMMFYDLLMAHHVIWGPADYLEDYADGLDARRLPAIEATRLLWNRGSGLYFALCDHACEGPREVIWRNLQKARLSLADAWLCLKGLHHPLVRVRHERLHQQRDYPLGREFLQWHFEAASFKERPTPAPPLEGLTEGLEKVRQAWGEMWLMAEEKRLGCPIDSLAAYAALARPLFPGCPTWRNLLLALRDRLRRGGMLKPVSDYPRGALMRSLALLLSADKALIQRVARHLPDAEGAPGKLTSWRASYERWWQFYG